MREALCLCLLLIVAACSRPGSGPVAIAYDKQPCAYCQMLIGDPRFAAQIISDAGDAIDFDDPGCLLHYLRERHPHARAIWFRDSQHDRWLTAADARFVRVPTSPMGWGLAVVAASGGTGLTYDEALANIDRPAVQRDRDE